MLHNSPTLPAAGQKSFVTCPKSFRLQTALFKVAPQRKHVKASVATLLNIIEKQEVKSAKRTLLDAVADCERGLRSGKFMRGIIEEAQVAVESFSEPELEWEKLAGKWRLVYTTALDVVPILAAEYQLKLPIGPQLLEVGNIYQRFSSPEEGVVENLIEASLLPGSFLERKNGLTFTVKAKYEVRSPRRIALTFEEAQVGQLRLAKAAEALLAPALLPRSSLNHALLLAAKELQIRVPFRSAQQVASAVSKRMSAAAGYQLTYLDDDMLIGRATQLGGSFVFVREDEQ